MTGFSATTAELVSRAYTLVARADAGNSTAAPKAPDQGGLISGSDPTIYDPKNPLGIIIIFTQALGMLLRRIRQPKVIAEVIGGILLGPSVCGHIPGFTQHIFPAPSRPYLSLVANVGLVLFLFIVGLELDVTFLRRNARLSVIIGMGGMLLPFGIGAGFSRVIYKNFVSPETEYTHFMLFMGVCFAITAFPVLCRILTELRLLDTTVGVVVLSAGVGNDIVGWILLALAVSLVNAASGLTALWILLATIGWALVVLFPGRLFIKWLGRKTGSTESGPTPFFITFVLVFMFASAFFTDVIGVHPIFGGFIVGISVPREGKLNILITEKIEDFVMMLMLPLYFALSGLNTDLGTLNEGKTWGFIISIGLLDFTGKFTGCSTAARLAGFKKREAFTVGTLMSCKGLVELIVLNVGLTAGILDTRLFSMFVIEALWLTFMTSPIVQAIYPPKHQTRVIGGKINVEAPASSVSETPVKRSSDWTEDGESSWRVRFTATLDKIEHLPAMMSLAELFQPVQKIPALESKRTEIQRSRVDALRLIELSDRTSAVMKSATADTLLHTDPLITVFRTFGGINDFPVSSALAVVPYDHFAESVGEHVRTTNSQMLLTSWVLEHTEHHVATPTNPLEGMFRSGGSDLASAAVHSQFLRNLFATSTVDVALFVDPGLGATSQESFGRRGKKHILLPFFGGPDDRLALSLVLQLCANPDISATVVRITKSDELQQVHSDASVALEKVPLDTVISTAGMADTMYGHMTTQTRLQSETADNVMWTKYTTASDSHPDNVVSALTRIQFVATSTPAPLARIAEIARGKKQEVEREHTRFLVMLGRSRRLATESHQKELTTFMHERGSSVNSDVRKTLGDVATAFVLSDVNAGLVVLVLYSTLNHHVHMRRGPQVSLSLKQRLGQLATSASTPSTPLSPQDSATSPRKSYFPTWGPKRGRAQSDDLPEPQDEERMQEVVSRFIFQAGVDFEVIICACAFPDPRDVSYDLLLTRVLAYLDLYVESDYTVVFFAAGNKHTPGWNWIWRAYRSLSRKYRKHLKKLYIVHSTWFSKMLVSLAGAVVSPKFFRKIQYIKTLSELAQYVPLTQIDIPPPVYHRENLRFEKQVILPVAHRSNLFGIPLEDLMGADSEKGGIPRVVKDCALYLRSTGMTDEGLFRRSPNTVMLNQAKQAYDRGHPVSLASFGDAHLAAVLLKKFLKDLPEPIVPEGCYPIIKRCPLPSDDPADMAAVMYIRESILPALHSHAAVVLLSYVLHLMHDVSLRSAINKMDAQNLAIVLAPNLVAGTNPARDVAMCFMSGPALFPGHVPSSVNEGKMTLAAVLKICIERYFEVFDDIPDRAEAVGPTASNSMEVMSSPDDAKSDASSDASMLVMKVGLNESSSPPPSSWGGATPAGRRSRYRVMSTPPSAMPTSAFSAPNLASSGLGATRSLYGGGNADASTAAGTIRGKTRSLLSIEKAINANGGRGSITIGKTVGTLKAAGAAVEAVSVTASGFFTPPSGQSTPSELAADRDLSASTSGSVRASTKPRELSEVTE
ncbi:hypothetical protein EXIGLDRAFT_701436 [Exidia glandulosa HHB12029]|uniref:Rho-GAP domain-containing protein n=1 Tax=Exidia glandulosa HHB12029 TaxID=1314781 RepID=A0A165CYG6_EXIGL|nr:hypothetical protein EXIGLDRAFT_701436 [Exidia glandulosa HHB12029]